tara:strand:- start:1236 stop:1709 length:474 start_codon:yes stop_codon:yes gene_type:complete
MATNIGTGPEDIPINQFLGEMAFRDAKPRVMMIAQKNTGMTLNTSATAVQFPNTIHDTHIGLSNTNSRYTVPYAGDYFVMFNLNALSNSNVTNFDIRVDGSMYSNYKISNTNHPRMNFALSAILPDVSAGSYIEIRGYVNTGTLSVDNFGNWQIYLM